MTKEKLDFDLSTMEGKLLWGALIELTTKLYTNKTPYEVLDLLEEVFDRCHPLGKNFVTKD